MGISKLSYGSGDNLFEISYKDDEIITTSGGTSYTSDNFESNTFAAFQNRKLTQFFDKGADNTYNNANEDNCMWRKWDSNNKTDLLPGSDKPDGYYTFNSLLTSVSNNRRIITDLTDLQRIIWRPEVMENPVSTVINGVATTVTTYVINTDTTQNYCDIIDKTNPMHYTAQNVPVFPWLLYPENKKELQLHFRREDGLSPYGSNCTRRSGARVTVNNRARYYPLSTALVNYDVPVGNNQTFGFYSDDNKYLFACTLSTNNYAQGTCICYIVSEDELKLWMASCGFKFVYKNVMYKPVAENNVIVGYTDDLSSQSDWDNWHTKDDHDKPVTPPSPGPSGGDEDNDDPVSTAGAPFAAGLCHYYALTAGSVLLEHISEALGTWDIENTHKDLYKNLVSCKLVKPPAAIPTTGSEAFTIYGVKPQYQGADITLPVVSGNPDASFGPYSIDRKFGDFRDYAPYTRVSIYLPYCGWCDLPSHVVGRSVSVHYYTDIIAATCKAVVFCNNNIIAEAAGVIGLDIPFVADNVGAKMQAVTAGMIAALGGGIQLGAGIGTMVSTKSGNGAKAALSGASQYLSGYSQMAMAFNENTTEISGKNGDGCCLAGATNIIIKIVRPKKGAYTDAPYVPPGYGHNIGFVSQKQVRVSSVSGLLIADNVDTSGISGATEAERAEIKRVLETGLIVNTAPE